jgi:hypothetical protein
MPLEISNAGVPCLDVHLERLSVTEAVPWILLTGLLDHTPAVGTNCVRSCEGYFLLHHRDIQYRVVSLTTWRSSHGSDAVVCCQQLQQQQHSSTSSSRKLAVTAMPVTPKL